MEAIGFEIDHQIRRLGLVGLKARRFVIGPIGQIHHYAPPSVVRFYLDGLHNVEAIAVKKIGVVAEQPFELRHRRMFLWNGFGIQLIPGLPDLCGIHLHRTLLSIEVSVRASRLAGPPTREWSRTDIYSFGRSAAVYLGWLLTRSTCAEYCAPDVQAMTQRCHRRRFADDRVASSQRGT